MTKKCFLLFAFAMLISGCNIFETRTPEPPQQAQSDFLPPTIYSIVIENLQNAIADRNVNNYVACFSDPTTGGRPFTFQPSPTAGRQYQSIFLTWDISSERGYFNNLVSQSSSSATPSLVLVPVEDQPGADSAYYSANYTLIWPNKNSSAPQQVQGNLQFYLSVNSSGNWSIYRWVDSGTSDTVKTWSDLKAWFSIQ